MDSSRFTRKKNLTPTVSTPAVGDDARAILMEFCMMAEGYADTAYPDPVNADGLPVTIGYGTTKDLFGKPWTVGVKINRQTAASYLNRDVNAAFEGLDRIPYWNELNAHQQAALADLNFNEGYQYGDGDHDSLDLALKMREYGRIGVILQLYDNNDELGLSRRRYASWLIWQGSGPKEAYFEAWAKNSVAEIMEAIAQ
jgi:GH24 family phage-related lysozyme (muramidase)